MKRQMWTPVEDGFLVGFYQSKEKPIMWEIVAQKMNLAGFGKTTKQVKRR